MKNQLSTQELQEIEETLVSHPEIDEAYVESDQNQVQENNLTAYIAIKEQIELWPSVGEYFLYDEAMYLRMATHQEKTEKYAAAFRKVLTGKTVVEIGPGSEAVLSILCLKAGAEKVYAIEYLQDTYEKARSKIESLGLENQIIVIHGDAMKTKLPEKVDYCISKILGGIGGLEGAAAIINNAHRFLKDSYHVIPQQTITKISALSLRPNRKIGFVKMAADYVERIFSHKGYRFDLRLRIKNVDKEDLCSSQGIFKDLDYRRELPLEHEHEIHLEFFKEGLCHGFLVWLTMQFDEENHLDVLESEDS